MESNSERRVDGQTSVTSALRMATDVLALVWAFSDFNPHWQAFTPILLLNNFSRARYTSFETFMDRAPKYINNFLNHQLLIT